MWNGLVMAVSFAVVVIALGSQPASAQGSPPIPTGGGSAYQVPGTAEGSYDYRKSLETWSPLGLALGRFLPRAWTVWSPQRSMTPVSQRRYWWGVMASR